MIRDKSGEWDWLVGGCRKSVNIAERVFQEFSLPASIFTCPTTFALSSSL